MSDGILPCCGLHRYEVKPTDRVDITGGGTVTCQGKKRYRDATRSGRKARKRAIKIQNRMKR